ncbi:Eco57I restriction-modification methylase domain-containing protein [Methanococcoides seepicolus]|uniref:site-specific DNA-methyltransferase (adenine-specific) n=1 Tax=Methanococcoides seepicolus TaxID=2828780 RepID=A0A9E4ZGX9_9EURY|nr:N-6 DNA methylase [Methanococcoides seepicolus]MCM1987487.1 Eco57I restriction-modification methylase domain-containing protein [Methanococcoides seepicolus]
MPAPQEIIKLVERFDQYNAKYTSQSYNETQVRREFIDPFFKALGWDVDNRKGRDERYKEVIHEDAVKVGGKTKAPDYSFRIGGMRKFFVEAKKPAVNLKENPEPAYQLRRYAWSAKLPISILTDFEELIVFDCTKKPSKTDKASLGRIKYFTYKEYIEKWDEIESLFSKESIFTGKFDDLADSLVKKKGGKGTAGIDNAFLTEIEEWREILAKNIALRNKDLSVRELNLAVQKIIDRIVFLRICEDRGIEEYEQLKKKAEGKDVYKNLIDLFVYADEKYNSGLFHFKKEDGSEELDILTTSLNIDDKILKQIIGQLYYPESPYEFSVFSSDILGQVYEQFLGKVIRLTASHQARIEEKPEVKKAGGVFYTPTYIVDYIAKNTVGKLVENKNPKEVAKLKILDPACGSGSFLIGAYQYLLDWHLNWYMDNLVPLMKDGIEATDKEVQKLLPVKPVSRKKGRGRGKKRAAGSDYHFPIYQMSKDDWRLTSDEKKRILINNIYGVDIDEQAVEVTKLSLLLKVLEGEKGERISKQLTITQERVLPSLHHNIKCGNSLIGPEIYSSVQVTLNGDEDFYRINAFDWKSEFSVIFESGGFDAVIGNPPYIRIQAMKEWAPLEVEFYKKLYESASKGNYDIYVVFVEKGLSLLNKDGVLGYILPHKFFNAKYGETIREIISEGENLTQVVHFGHEQVFKNATTYTCLLFLDKEKQRTFIFKKVNSLDLWKKSKNCTSGEISHKEVTSKEWNFVVGKGSDLYRKLTKLPIKLQDITEKIYQGLVTGADPVFILEKTADNQFCSAATGKNHRIEPTLMHQLCKGSVDIKRYYTKVISKYILFPYKMEDGKATLIGKDEFKNNYPLAWKYLKNNQPVLESREKGKWKHEKWYAFGRSQNLNEMEKIKIITPSIAQFTSFVLDAKDYKYFVGSGGGGGGGYGLLLKDSTFESYHFILGILNSKLVDWYVKLVSTPFRGGYYAYNRQYIENIPIVKIDTSNSEVMNCYNRTVYLVGQMLELHKKLNSSKLSSDKEMIKRRIDATDAEINGLVYELYGLTEDEIKIVEESFA